uniref:DUF6598 domain-containing protein n=2 Tax=Oryza sativa subsp. japonica TaxID=39947 RepID=Q53PQ8_ORYSJ|nr:hypothetical protein LOC_Os11g06560 [Oryza sativa Japonica Group]AAX95267.1 hypothetical protein [Oryza sativa Japonica Group]ABA91688.1 hypothetical protein LOC_Os11g06560 [Oryza sativa Japonica Group]
MSVKYDQGADNCSTLRQILSMNKREYRGKTKGKIKVSKGNLVLTGPSFAISVYVGIDLINLHDGSQEEEDDDEEDNVGEIFCNTCTCDFTDYNSAIVETVITWYGPAEVTYVVLTNAFQ